MTDAATNQIALIVPGQSSVPGRAAQIAVIVPCNDIPPPAAGAKTNQIALISVDREYELFPNLHGWLIRSIQGFPYFIEDDGL